MGCEKSTGSVYRHIMIENIWQLLKCLLAINFSDIKINIARYKLGMLYWERLGSVVHHDPHENSSQKLMHECGFILKRLSMPSLPLQENYFLLDFVRENVSRVCKR